MADNDLQANDALERTSPDGGQSEQASTAAQDGKAEKGTQETQTSKRVNLQEIPEFKEYQSKTDRQRAELERIANLAKQEAAETKRRLEALEDQAYGKDDYGKVQLIAQRAAREAEAAKRELAAYREREAADTAKMEAVSKMATKYNVPASDLMDAKDYDDLVDKAIAARDRLREAKLKEKEQVREDNSPDLGGGGRSTAKTRAENDYDQAAKRGDSVAMMRALRLMQAEAKRR